ncbi:hypothetical protein MVEN_01769000 [Mycena venus]|uniref:Uncharacterized protein n=1 Tax=Mycena venus TaxID=2733690 RepID=A0A8H6XLR8_9AGAR|nr:hypothetical protein MVEN_01769000 [Mycena venus]
MFHRFAEPQGNAHHLAHFGLLGPFQYPGELDFPYRHYPGHSDVPIRPPEGLRYASGGAAADVLPWCDEPLIDWEKQTDDVFIGALTLMCPLQHLRKLTIFPRSAGRHRCSSLPYLYPALEELIVLWDFNHIDHLRDDVPLTLAPDAVPLLNCYQGPDASLMEGRPVHHLAVPRPKAQLQGDSLLMYLQDLENRE